MISVAAFLLGLFYATLCTIIIDGEYAKHALLSKEETLLSWVMLPVGDEVHLPFFVMPVKWLSTKMAIVLEYVHTR